MEFVLFEGFSARVLAFTLVRHVANSGIYHVIVREGSTAEFGLLVIVTIELFRYKTIDDGVRVYAKLLKGAWLVNLTKPVDHHEFGTVPVNNRGDSRGISLRAKFK